MDEILLKNYLLPFFGAFLISIMATFFVRKLALKLKVIDAPSEPRKIHSQAVPLLGGLAVYLAFVALLAVFYQAGFIADGRIGFSQIIGIVIGGGLLMIGGYFDDKYNLKPVLQLIWPVLAALMIVFSGFTIGYVSNPLGGLIYLGSGLISPLIIFFWLLGMMYTTKFLDGLDGLVSGIAAIGFIILFLVSLFWDVPLSGTSILCLLLAGSSLGFLIWNFHPAKIFLGEGGSLFLGFMLGVLAIISGAKIATTLLIMGIPILDVIWVIIRRTFKEKKPAFLGDAKHLHFRLIDAGLNHRQAVLLLYLLTAVFGSLAIFQQTVGKLVTLGILLVVMVMLGWWVVSRYRGIKKGTS